MTLIESSPDSAGTAFVYTPTTNCDVNKPPAKLPSFKLVDGQSRTLDFPGCAVQIALRDSPDPLKYWTVVVKHRRRHLDWVQSASCVPADEGSVSDRWVQVDLWLGYRDQSATCTIAHAPQPGTTVDPDPVSSCEAMPGMRLVPPPPLDGNLARAARSWLIEPPDSFTCREQTRMSGGVAAGPPGYLFLAFEDGLLAKYSIAQHRIVKRAWVRPPVKQVGEDVYLSEATRDPAGALIAPTGGGLVRVSPDGTVSFDRVLRAKGPWDLVARPEGVYAGSRAGGGVNLIRGGRVVRRWSKYRNLANVTDLTEGLDGRPWVSTVKGIASLPKKGLARLIDPHTGRKSQGLGGFTSSIARSGSRVYFTSGSQIGWLDRAMRPHAGCRLPRPYGVTDLRLQAPGLLTGALDRGSTLLRYTVVLNQATHRVYAVRWPGSLAWQVALDWRGRAWTSQDRRLYQFDIRKPDKMLCKLR